MGNIKKQQTTQRTKKHNVTTEKQEVTYVSNMHEYDIKQRSPEGYKN